MEYLKEYEETQKSNSRNFIKQWIIDKFWIEKAVYFSRVLKATGIDIEFLFLRLGVEMAYSHSNIIRKVIDDFYKERFETMGIEFYCKDISR